MDISVVWDLVVLFGLGLAGWAVFYRLHLPVAPFLGSLMVLIVMRSLGVELPSAPGWLFLFLQICLGMYIGTKVTREAVRDIKPMLSAAIIIVAWTLSVILILGPFLAWATRLDLNTAILSSSMGGLPEITMIALATDANLGFIILMQMVRMLITVAVFPLVIKRWMAIKQPEVKRKRGRVDLVSALSGPGAGSREAANNDGVSANNFNKGNYLNSNIKDGIISDEHRDAGKNNSTAPLSIQGWDEGGIKGDDSDNSRDGLKTPRRDAPYYFKRVKDFFSYESLSRTLPVLAAAACGGAALHFLGVPAGVMVGSTIAVAAVSLSGLKPLNISPFSFNLMLVTLGIAVSDNIVPGEFAAMGGTILVIPIIISTVLIFFSSFLVTLLIHKVSGWDFPTSFLAAAPGGFSVMVALSIRYNKDPFKVSMLHLCRLLSIKMVLPFLFMYLS